MTDEAAFLAAIDAAPLDEAPHKVFADWLNERGRDDEATYHRGLTAAYLRSQQWLRDFCSTADCPDYGTMIHALKTGTVPGGDPEGYSDYFNVEWDSEQLHFGGYDAHGQIPPEFWDHVSVILGREIEANERPERFSCSC